MASIDPLTNIYIRRLETVEYRVLPPMESASKQASVHTTDSRPYPNSSKSLFTLQATPNIKARRGSQPSSLSFAYSSTAAATATSSALPASSTPSLLSPASAVSSDLSNKTTQLADGYPANYSASWTNLELMSSPLPLSPCLTPGSMFSVQDLSPRTPNSDQSYTSQELPPTPGSKMESSNLIDPHYRNAAHLADIEYEDARRTLYGDEDEDEDDDDDSSQFEITEYYHNVGAVAQQAIRVQPTIINLSKAPPLLPLRPVDPSTTPGDVSAMKSASNTPLTYNTSNTISNNGIPSATTNKMTGLAHTMSLANHTDMSQVNRARKQSIVNCSDNLPSSSSSSAMVSHTMENEIQRSNQAKSQIIKKRPKTQPVEAVPATLYTSNDNNNTNNPKPPLKPLRKASKEGQALANKERMVMMERKATDERANNMPELAALFSDYESSDMRDQAQRTRRKSSAAAVPVRRKSIIPQRTPTLSEHTRGTNKPNMKHRETATATTTATSSTRPSIISFAQMRKSYLNNCTSHTQPTLEFDLSKLTISNVYPTSDISTTSSDGIELEWIDNDELEQQEMGRLAAVISLIRREQKHLRALVLLNGAFAEPIYKAYEQARRHPFSNFDRTKLERIFAIPTKMIPFHKMFLHDLELAVEKHSTTGTLSEVITTFDKHMPGFRYYLHYMDKDPEMISLLDELSMNSDFFRQTLEECTEQVEHVNVRALLGNSREHIPYYYGFLQKMVELYSPEEPEYNGFAECVAQFQEINAEAEKLACIALQREEAKRIQTSMKGYNGILATPTRRLIHQGNLAAVSLLSGKSTLRTCLLFNDILVFAKEKSDGRLHYKGHIDLGSAYATELPPDQFVNLFAIMDSSNKKYYFQAEDEQGCHEWVQYINEVINAI